MIKYTLRITEEEKELLDLKSKTLKKSKNEILRYLINKHLVEIEKEQELLNELNNNYKNYAFQLQKIGTVLNQINKNFYAGKGSKINEIEKELETLWQFIKVLKE